MSRRTLTSRQVDAVLTAIRSRIDHDAKECARAISEAVELSRIGDGEFDNVRADGDELDAYAYACDLHRLAVASEKLGR